MADHKELYLYIIFKASFFAIVNLIVLVEMFPNATKLLLRTT